MSLVKAEETSDEAFVLCALKHFPHRPFTLYLTTFNPAVGLVPMKKGSVAWFGPFICFRPVQMCRGALCCVLRAGCQVLDRNDAIPLSLTNQTSTVPRPCFLHCHCGPGVPDEKPHPLKIYLTFGPC